MLGKRFQQQSNIKLAQLYYFLSQNVGGVKRYYVPPCPKVGGTCPTRPPINSVPAWRYTKLRIKITVILSCGTSCKN